LAALSRAATVPNRQGTVRSETGPRSRGCRDERVRRQAGWRSSTSRRVTVRCDVLPIAEFVPLFACGGSYSFDFERRNRTKTTKNAGSPIVNVNATPVDAMMSCSLRTATKSTGALSGCKGRRSQESYVRRRNPVMAQKGTLGPYVWRAVVFSLRLWLSINAIGSRRDGRPGIRGTVFGSVSSLGDRSGWWRLPLLNPISTGWP
jgi:hypothetical protein